MSAATPSASDRRAVDPETPVRQLVRDGYDRADVVKGFRNGLRSGRLTLDEDGPIVLTQTKRLQSDKGR